MSAETQTEADSTTSEEEVKKEVPKQEEAPVSSDGKVENSSNGLSLQLEEKIIRQVEYYFGDRNLPRDKFLQSAAAENDGGWVPVSTLLTFNRLKSLSSDPAYIVSALRKSAGNILEVNSEGTSVRRSPDNPPPDIFSPEQRQRMKEKTVYVKGFDEDEKLDDIQSFLDEYGKLEHVQMRKTLTDKTFKGSIFAEFKEKKVAESFLGLPTIQFKGKELIKESKEAYYRRKGEERKQVKESKKAGDAASTTVPSKVQTKGAVLYFKGLKATTTREDIKEVMQEFATVAFIDFRKGDTEGYIRFEEENGAPKAMEGLKASAPEGASSPQLCGADVEMKVLEGTDEEKYWLKAAEERSKGRSRVKKGRGSHFGDRKRRQKSRAGDGPVAKQQKQEEEEAGTGEGVVGGDAEMGEPQQQTKVTETPDD